MTTDQIAEQREGDRDRSEKKNRLVVARESVTVVSM